ncbi:MAG: MFS transporter [Hyphomicrobiales bacterium]
MGQPRLNFLLFIIVLSQFAGTSLWFSGNAILPDLEQDWGLAPEALGHITMAVQLGFIAGTLSFAVLTLADRYSPRWIYLICCLSGALVSATTVLIDENLSLFLANRFLVGFLLAGIYPVGMKIASGWFKKDLGLALGFMIGALVLGTAAPHLVRAMGEAWAWQTVILSVAVLAAFGGVLMAVFVPDGPHLKQASKFDFSAVGKVFSSAKFRSSSFGYFGHMWEIFAAWAFFPVLLVGYVATRPELSLNISLWTFIIIGVGAIGCAGGGVLVRRFGSARVATFQLFGSLIGCLISPLMFFTAPEIFLPFVIIWSILISGDSPQYSTLNAQFAPPALVGCALAVANAIGYTISIVSVQLINHMVEPMGVQYVFLLLIPGPLFGLWAMWSLVKRHESGQS